MTVLWIVECKYSLTSWGLTCNSNDRNWYIPWPSIALSIMPVSFSDNMSLPMVRHFCHLFLDVPWDDVWSYGNKRSFHQSDLIQLYILDYTMSMLKGCLYKGNFREASATFIKHGYLNLFYQCLIVLFNAIVIIVYFKNNFCCV